MPMVCNPDILLFLVLLALYEYSANLCSSEDFYASGILYFGIFCGKKGGSRCLCMPSCLCLFMHLFCMFSFGCMLSDVPVDVQTSHLSAYGA